jgi:hypothetical protein
MSYYIDILDTSSEAINVVLQRSSASGIILKWNGGDKKDDLAIVSTELNFDILVDDATDAALIDFFTGDETRFKVQLKDSADDSFIWQGYVLPDLYSEPYKNNSLFVSFTATDGLGRLKGKYLPAEYYDREKSLINIYCAILKLTGLQLNLFFNPAIENNSNKDWNTIYVDTATFLEKDKKKDCFSIIETLLKDTLCVLYQAENRWYIEGLNTRNIRSVQYKQYDVDALFINTFDYIRNIKEITALPEPLITIIPPYNEITITHEKTEPSLPATLSQEVNDGWSIVTGVTGVIYASDWMANGGFFAKALFPDYYSRFYNKSYFPGNAGNINYDQDDSQWISLKEKLFYSKGQKAKFSFGFSIIKPGITTANPGDMTLWENPFKYELIYNDAVIFSNFNETVTESENLIFEAAGNAKIEIEHIFLEDGLFDIKIYGPPGTTNTNRIQGIEITKADVEIIGFVELESITDLINGDFTIDKEVELTYAADKSGFSKGFRLYKLKENAAFFNEIEVPIFYGFEQSGKYYSVVQLEGANLIKDNLYTTYKSSVLVTVLDVIYNFNLGEQMVVQTDVLHDSGSFFVKKYAVDDFIDNRNTWIEWSDAVYKIEKTSYLKTVSNIYRRLFNSAHEKIDLIAFNAVKFNDIILFKFVYQKEFFVLNCAWNLDDNKTNMVLARSFYQNAGVTATGDENVIPIVLAGDDVYITDAQTTGTLLAEAYDPDGFISSQQWTKLEGDFGDIIESPYKLETNLENLTADYYVYQIEVTDDKGATATDTVKVLRIKDYTVTLDLVSSTGAPSTGSGYQEWSKLFELNISPAMSSDMNIVFSGRIAAQIDGIDVQASYTIKKNDFIIESGNDDGGIKSLTVSVNANDTVFFELAVNGDDLEYDNGYANAFVDIKEVTVANGRGNFIGLPVFEEIEITT